MWGYLVLTSGCFFYAIAAVHNAKATANPTTTIYQSSGDSMFLLHQLAKQRWIAGDWSGRQPIDFTQLQQKTYYKDPRWKAQLMDGAPGYGKCLLTYKLTDTIEVGNPETLVSSLTQFSGDHRSVGFIDASGQITKSVKGPPFAPPGGAKDTPFIYECNIRKRG